MYDLFSQQTTSSTPAQIMSIPTQPEERSQGPAPRIFTNIPDLIAEIRTISHADKMTWAQFNQLYKDMTAQAPEIMAMINKMTIADINKYVYKLRSGETKKDMCERLYDSLFGSFNISGNMLSYSPAGFGYSGSGPTSWEEALKIQLSKQTEEDFNKYQAEAQADRDQRKKALTNPETLEEFRIFLQYRKPEVMTSEQRALYDRLITESKQGQRARTEERQAEVTAVKVEGLEMEIKTSYHAKKNIPLWVVVMSDRVDSNVFNDLKIKAKKFDGYYSSYRAQGAIPGFTFEAAENARLFAGLTESNQSAHEIQQEIKAEAAQERAETLEEKATRIKEVAEGQLNQDRKTNTHKRASQAASAERAALYNIEFAETMAKIAQGQQDGTIKFLTALRAIADLETLNAVLSAAKMRYIKAKDIRYEDYELTPEVVDFVVFPYPSIWKSNGVSDCMKLRNTPGCKMAAARVGKRLDAFKEEVYYFTRTHEIEDFETLFCTAYRNVPHFYGNPERYKEELMKYKRCMRMRLESLPELRTALRELVNIKLNTTISPEMKKAQEIRELERKFIGVKIDGFFPTPRDLAEQIVNLAEVKPGNTILEPSAGLGHLADVISELHPDNDLKVVEISYSLSEALRLKGYEIAEREDFLNHTGTYDRIIMNPPFENGQDMDHVRHAYSLLNEGGRLVAIMAANKGNTDRKTAEFNQFIQNNGGSITPNNTGSFLSAFRPTGVNTITVILDK
jgi:hypothetical protein